MQDKVNNIVNLIDKHLKGTLSPGEKKELDSWIQEAEENRILFSQVTNKEILAEKLHKYDSIDSDSVWQKTIQKINTGEGMVVQMPSRANRWKRVIAAAAILIAVSVGGTWIYVSYLSQNADNKVKVVDTTPSEIVPGSEKATLELSDGTIIDLNELNDGVINTRGGVEVTKRNGQLIYNPGSDARAGTEYNTITTPKGGEYRVTLPDGSKVHLNAASSLRFPIAFAGNERQVQLAGEAYFEVLPLAQNPGTGGASGNNIPGENRVPFTVKIAAIPNGGGESEVRVLGTGFNVMAYEDEAAVKTTLLDGKVLIIKDSKTAALKPNQQASIKNGTINVIDVDAEDIASWKNGYLPLDGCTPQEALNKIARWYNLEIKYKGNVPEELFRGSISRTTSIEGVIQMLETYNLKVQLENRTITVMP